MNTAYLVLEDGVVFSGTAWGSQGLATGELRVCTAVTGHQAVLADPQNSRAIVLMTAPHIGNVGINSEFCQKFHAQGVIVREPARRVSNWKSEGNIEDTLVEHRVVGIAGVDTRAVALRLREHGTSMRCAIVSGSALPAAVSTTDNDMTTAVVQVAAAAILSMARDEVSDGQEQH